MRPPRPPHTTMGVLLAVVQPCMPLTSRAGWRRAQKSGCARADRHSELWSAEAAGADTHFCRELLPEEDARAEQALVPSCVPFPCGTSPSICSLPHPCLPSWGMSHGPRTALSEPRAGRSSGDEVSRPPGRRWSASPGGFLVSPLNSPGLWDFLIAPTPATCLIILYESWSPSTRPAIPGHPSRPPLRWGCQPAPHPSGDGPVVPSLPQTDPFLTTIWLPGACLQGRATSVSVFLPPSVFR